MIKVIKNCLYGIFGNKNKPENLMKVKNYKHTNNLVPIYNLLDSIETELLKHGELLMDSSSYYFFSKNTFFRYEVEELNDRYLVTVIV